MSIRYWIGQPYNNTRECEQVADFIVQLESAFKNTDELIHVLFNPQFPGYPNNKGKSTYVSTPDIIILKSGNAVIVELKNYKGSIQVDTFGAWRCYQGGEGVVIKGGTENRTPFKQVEDYRNQFSDFLYRNNLKFMNGRKKPFDYKKFVSCVILFPDYPENPNADLPNGNSWMKPVRLRDAIKTILSFQGGRDSILSEDERRKLAEKALRLSEAIIVDNIPMKGKKEETPPQPIVKEVVRVVQVDVPKEVIKTVEKKVYIEKEVPILRHVNDEYGAIAAIWDSDEPSAEKILSFFKIFKRVVWKQLKQRYPRTQFTSLYAGLNELFRDMPEELSLHAHELRLCGNAIRNDPNKSLLREDVAESFKTVCGIVEFFCQEEMPNRLAEECERIIYRPIKKRVSTFYKEKIIRITVLQVSSEEIVGTVQDDTSGENRTFYIPSNRYKNMTSDIQRGDTVGLLYGDENVTEYGPDAVILEPDFLLSPQAIGTACEYQQPSIYFWLNTLKEFPGESKEPYGKFTLNAHLLRGNFANICLASSVAREEIDFNSLMKRYFQTALLDIVDENPEKEWLMECKSVQKNIEQKISSAIPNDFSANWQIEAPFFSPIFGLSAQADAVKYDKERQRAIVFELKSGKWNEAKTWNGFKDSAKEKHRVQPRFYTDLINAVTDFKRSSITPILFYASGEGKDFVETGTWNIIRDYCNIRNHVIRLLKEIAKGDFNANSIASLSAEDFVAQEVPSRPKTIAAVNKIIDPFKSLLSNKNATSYFNRFLKFLANEELQSRIGGDESSDDHSGTTPSWRRTLKERKESGITLCDLRLVANKTEVDAFDRVFEFTFDTSNEQLNVISTIRKGDAVCLYQPSNAESNVTNSIVFLATVSERTTGTVTVRLQDPQKSSLFDLTENASFIIEQRPASYMTTGYKGLFNFVTGNKCRQDIILSPATATASFNKLPISNLGKYDQTHQKILQEIWNANDLYLIWGPPGTGKTSHMIRAIVDCVMANPKMNILLLAYTYKAADEICSMLQSRMKSYPDDQFLCIGSEDKFSFEDIKQHRATPEILGSNRQTASERLAKIRIVVGTVAALRPSNPIFRLKHFDLAVIDEASQLLDTHILPLFCSTNSEGAPLIGKFVLVGDDRQLPAIVQQHNALSSIDKAIPAERPLYELGFRNCRESFFSRARRSIEAFSRPLFGKLLRQYRMHQDIMAFCNSLYDNSLSVGDTQPGSRQIAPLPPVPPGITGVPLHVLSRRLACFPITSNNRKLGGKASIEEANLCTEIIETLHKHRHYTADNIGIVVPFRSQIATIREALLTNKNLGARFADNIFIDTVERAQGSERDVIIFSTVIQNPQQAGMISATLYEDDDDGEMSIDQKLNVAITRAKEQFFILGNVDVLRRLKCYGELVEWISNHGGLYEGEAPF